MCFMEKFAREKRTGKSRVAEYLCLVAARARLSFLLASADFA
jgi:hypothetical protein